MWSSGFTVSISKTKSTGANSSKKPGRSSPQIVKISDFAKTSDGHLIIALEYMPGGDLDALIVFERLDSDRAMRGQVRVFVVSPDDGLFFEWKGQVFSESHIDFYIAASGERTRVLEIEGLRSKANSIPVSSRTIR